MAEEFHKRLERIAAGILPGCAHIEPLGDDYFTFEMTGDDGTKSALPHVWINPNASDNQLRDKLRRAYQEALHPETLPDDASVPDLRTEETRGEN